METQNNDSVKAQAPQCDKTTVMCCDSFQKNIHNFGWFKLDHLGEDQYLMPHILGTNYRINFCPSCGKEVRDIVLSSDFYHNT